MVDVYACITRYIQNYTYDLNRGDYMGVRERTTHNIDIVDRDGPCNVKELISAHNFAWTRPDELDTQRHLGFRRFLGDRRKNDG